MSNTAWQFEHSVRCNSDKSFAWAFWTDVSNWQRLEGKAVEWIKLHGPFAVGTLGATQTPGQKPYTWKIIQLDPEHSATIEMPLDGAVFCNVMIMESINPDSIQITQRLSLNGTKAPDFVEGVRTFETSAPQGLAKLAKAIESAYNTVRFPKLNADPSDTIKMEELETLYLTERKAWREWLRKNFEKKNAIWLVYPKKSTGKPRIEYNTAVEEALCFGWIDSTVKSLDADHTIQRFTQRRPKSGYSQANKERLKWLFKEDMLHHSIKESVQPIVDQEFKFPSDILEEIRKNPKAWENYQKLSDPYKRIRIAYIDSARKRPEEFNKRLLNFIAKTQENQLIKGFGGIDKYY